ncbi:MOSC domain-containing protein [Thiomicrorhabdus hydrogeniphila]
MAKLIGIATHKESGGCIASHEEIFISLENGLKNDYQGKKSINTQVTLLSLTSWQKACKECLTEINWTERRANLLIDDIELSDSMIGKQVQIGQVLLEVTQETDPCNRMEEIQPGLKKALTPEWRGGARCKVLREGYIKYGDNVTVLKRF